MSSHPSSPSRDLHILAVVGAIGAVILVILPLLGTLILFGLYRRTLPDLSQSVAVPPVATSTDELTPTVSSTAPQILSIRLEGAQLSAEGVYGVRSGVPVLISTQVINAKTVDIMMVPHSATAEAEPLGEPVKQPGGVYTLSWTPLGYFEAEIEIRATSNEGTAASHRIQVAAIEGTR
jgi:hypothetical protein